jgi:hypothetical protein
MPWLALPKRHSLAGETVQALIRQWLVSACGSSGSPK